MALSPQTGAGAAEGRSTFAGVIGRHGAWPLRRRRVTTVQVNLGKLCNQACHHCHVDAGPKRTEVMRPATAERIVALLERSPSVETVDFTGGAPELNPNFRRLVDAARQLGLQVIDRCNLTVAFEPGMEGLFEYLGDRQVELICSLPCYSAKNVDGQRGRGVFDRSIEALRNLNRLGYGQPDSPLRLNLVYNPLGPFLPPPQAELENDYRRELEEQFGIRFHRLLTITNMPIKRFADQLSRSRRYEEYMSLLIRHFNPATVGALMCRELVSVGWDGALFDCDFNQMLELPLGTSSTEYGGPSLWDIERFEDVANREIATGAHCFGCTAGAGSSCGGALGSLSRKPG